MNKIILSAAILLTIFKTVTSVKCYVCNTTDSSTPFQCGELFERYDTPDIKPKDCSSVHGAQYCVKHTGRFEAIAIKCYQCKSSETIDCADEIINMHDSPIQPEDCDSVHDAKYCIKSTALDGGIGAKRFCSSKDMGNYCNYVQNKGDRMEYRSCIFTCQTDGCNLSTNLLINNIIIGGSIFLLLGLKRLVNSIF